MINALLFLCKLVSSRHHDARRVTPALEQHAAKNMMDAMKLPVEPNAISDMVDGVFKVTSCTASPNPPHLHLLHPLSLHGHGT